MSVQRVATKPQYGTAMSWDLPIKGRIVTEAGVELPVDHGYEVIVMDNGTAVSVNQGDFVTKFDVVPDGTGLPTPAPSSGAEASPASVPGS